MYRLSAGVPASAGMLTASSANIVVSSTADLARDRVAGPDEGGVVVVLARLDIGTLL
jgi:hypothetical protein